MDFQEDRVFGQTLEFRASKFLIEIKVPIFVSIFELNFGLANGTEPNKNSLNDWNIFILEIR